MRIRAVAALMLVASACGRDDRADAPEAASALPTTGPDPVVVRIPREGGIVRAFRYAGLDSVIWRSNQRAPATERLLGFDAENGVLAYLGSDGRPGWFDLRQGTVRAATRQRLTSIASADGWSIFGVSDSNAVVRLTPTGDWTRPITRPVRRLFPLGSGTLLVLADEGSRSFLFRLRPPDETVSDSVEVPRPDRSVATPLGDRLYLGVKRELVSVQPQSFDEIDSVEADDEILAITPTPSGDRIFIANRGGPRLEVMDRYAENIEASVRLPGLVTELRMDPMGRYLLARPVNGDSVWVVAIATERVVGTVASDWRADLPTVTVDGQIAVARGADVLFITPSTGAATRTIDGGARDLWHFMLWNGFRPRSEGLDQPVQFALDESERSVGDSIRRIPRRDTALPDTVAPPGSTSTALPPPPAPPPAPARDSWTVSFAAVLSEARAREIAETITVDGQHPRIVRGETAGTTVYRVIFGPYNSKADAERVGRASRHNYWVYEGVP